MCLILKLGFNLDMKNNDVVFYLKICKINKVMKLVIFVSSWSMLSIIELLLNLLYDTKARKRKSTQKFW